MPPKVSMQTESEAYRCSRCGFCRSICPVFDVKMVESWSPRGRTLIVRAYNEDKVNPSKELLDRIFSCTLCKACEEICPSGIKVVKIIESMRRDLVTKGYTYPLHESMAQNILKFNNPYGKNIAPKVELPKLLEGV